AVARRWRTCAFLKRMQTTCGRWEAVCSSSANDGLWRGGLYREVQLREQLTAVGGTETGIQLAAVIDHGVDADLHALGNVLFGEALAEPVEGFRLLWRQAHVAQGFQHA